MKMRHEGDVKYNPGSPGSSKDDIKVSEGAMNGKRNTINGMYSARYTTLVKDGGFEKGSRGIGGKNIPTSDRPRVTHRRGTNLTPALYRGVVRFGR